MGLTKLFKELCGAVAQRKNMETLQCQKTFAMIGMYSNLQKWHGSLLIAIAHEDGFTKQGLWLC